jgi:hypothetical protein
MAVRASAQRAPVYELRGSVGCAGRIRLYVDGVDEPGEHRVATYGQSGIVLLL